MGPNGNPNRLSVVLPYIYQIISKNSKFWYAVSITVSTLGRTPYYTKGIF